MADNINNGRRRVLTTVTTGVGLAGAAALAVPLVASMKPSARARAGGAPVEVDITDLAPGQMKVVEWRGKPVWILRRDETMLLELASIVADLSDPNSAVVEQQPDYARNAHAPSVPMFWSCSEFAPTLAARPARILTKGSHRVLAMTGLVDSSVPVTAPSLIFPVGSIRTYPPRLILKCRRIPMCRITVSSSG